MKRLITIAAVLLLSGCVSAPALIECAGDSNVCYVVRDGFHPEVIYLRRMP
jgi:starvation-inducible outer membrane lipoprotein